MQDGCLKTGDITVFAAADGYGMREKPCPVSRAPADIQARESDGGGLVGGGIDLFSQAAKALTERSPYDVEVSEKDGGQGLGVTTLPAVLVGLLAKYMDRRRRHKKSHSGVDSKKKSSIRQTRCGNIWIETDVYFRELTLCDIETLFDLSAFLTPGCMKCLSIPEVVDAVVTNSLHSAEAAAPSSVEDVFIACDTVSANGMGGNGMVAIGDPSDSVAAASRSGYEMVSTGVAIDNAAATNRSDDEMVSIGVPGEGVTAACRSDDELVFVRVPTNTVAATCRSDNDMFSNGVLDASVVATGGSGEEMDVDDEKVIKDVCPEEEKSSSPHSSPRPSASVEWVLGSKNKILLASERPSKKRKLLGENAGLDKLIVSHPCEGNPNLCHFCSQGDNESESSNRLIVCSTCGVAVHKKCYGVEENDIVESTWFCSWCKHTNNSGEVAARDMNGDSKPCLLCPKQGGALKPLKTKDVGNPGPIKFAHLFCSQWMPEVFVEDTKLMEPIVNVDGIKETRRKFLCSICKVKYGACVRCSNGTCRASFHPICAREANHRSEIWGKAGNIDTRMTYVRNDALYMHRKSTKKSLKERLVGPKVTYALKNTMVELRAFCSKHSDIRAGNEDVQQVDFPTTTGNDTSQAMTSSEALLNEHEDSKFGSNNGDISHMQLEAPCNSKKRNGVFVDEALQNDGVVMDLEPENCSAEHSLDAEALEVNHIDGIKPSVAFLLKRLIDRGKVNVEEFALEMGMPPHSLAATLATGTLTPEYQNKAVSWLRSHAYLGCLQRNIRVRIKSAVCSDSKLADVTLECDAPRAVPVKSVPPRRRTHSNVRILEVNRSSLLSKDKLEDETMRDETQGQNSASKPNGLTDGSLHDSIEKVLPYPASIPSTMKPSTIGTGFDTLEIMEPENPSITIGGTTISNTGSVKKGPPSDIQVSVYGKLMQIKSDICFSEADNELNVCRPKQIARLESSPSDGICHLHETQTSAYSDTFCENRLEFEQLSEAKVLRIFDMTPGDELEGELVYCQHKLLETKLKRKRFSDGLVCMAVKSLPSQIDFSRSQRWDSVFVNKYFSDVREAKKLGRKEKRRKEAQAVLAAATAAAASSSRISTFRKDDLDESSQENPAKASHMLRPGSRSQLMPLPKETMSMAAVPKVAPEKESNFFQSNSDFNKDNPRSCDVCCRKETILNSLLVCSICKVSVHLNCYHNIKDFIGPWHCEFCQDLLSQCPRPLPMNSWERPVPGAECAVCGGTVGAFRKSADGQWIHAFCAEWILQSTFRRGQIYRIEGLESITMGNDACCVCQLKKGVCLKCHYGHCQSTFHPSCARIAGFYMSIKSSGRKILHKAYCKKHSSEQRSKDENQKHGTDELKSVKQVRVELERLRLLCERIVRREKLKRDLLICSHAILASKRDSVAFSVLVHSPFFRPDMSSDSATMSLYNSVSEAIQKFDEVTVDSISSVKKPLDRVGSMENDRKTDESSTSQLVFARKHTRRMPCAGKKIHNVHIRLDDQC